MIVDGVRLVSGTGISMGVVSASSQGNTLPASATEGDEYELTALYAGKQPGLYWWHSGEWVLKSPDRSATPYDISGGSVSTLGASAVIMRLVVARAFGLVSGFFGSLAVSGQGPASNIALEIRRIDRSGADSKIGEIQFGVGSTTGVFVQEGSGVMRFAQGEVLYVRGPETPDLTLNDLSVTLAGFLF